MTPLQRRSFDERCFQLCLNGGILHDARRELWSHLDLKYTSKHSYQEYLERSEKELDPAERMLARSDARRYPEVLLESVFDHRTLDR